MASPNLEPRRHLGLNARASLMILLGGLYATSHVREASSASSAPNGTEQRASSGVFSEEQRRSGLQVYLKQCSSCHGERLRGGESAPALTGANFRAHWIGRNLDELMQKIAAMPPKDPGQLTPEEAASVIAAILAANAYPPGDRDLPANLGFERIRIDPLKSP